MMAVNSVTQSDKNKLSMKATLSILPARVVAKIAAQSKREDGKSTMVISTDEYASLHLKIIELKNQVSLQKKKSKRKK